MVEYTKGLHELAEGVWGWLAPDGSWCLSNAGLIRGDGASFLVDTLFDYDMTREMLTAMATPTADAPIVAALNTHNNGDHTYGNKLLDPAVRIHATTHTGHEIDDLPPERFMALLQADMGPVLTPYLQHCFGAFNLDGVELRRPDVTFDGELVLDIGGREVCLVELAPAHTMGDSVAFVRDCGVLFAGDLLFVDGTSISWSGAVDNWIAACDTMIGWDPQVVVPGHGPVTDVAGIRAARDYLAFVLDYAQTSQAAGLPWHEAADRIDLGPYATLGDPERVVVTLHQVYRRADPSIPEVSPVDLFGHMAAWRAKHVAA
jgi:glyoxylase-like metal-dependent hydrolase (beta-lactamase superfamily II)